MVVPYILFHGRCSDALRFYEDVYGSEAEIMPYGDYVPEGAEQDVSQWVLHAELNICGSNCWFADEVSDIRHGNSIRLSVSVPETQKAREYFERLSEGGTVLLPPTQTFYSEFHASVIDRFGVGWDIVSEQMAG